MHRIDSNGAAVAIPTPGAVGSTVGYFTEGNPGTGVPSTVVSGDWLNAVQEELINALVAAGITPSKTSRTQLTAAIRALAISHSPTINVKDVAYGAVGDNTTDDTTAIQNAINALGTGGTLLFPPGIYKTTGDLTISTSQVRVIGSGMGSAKINFTAGHSLKLSASKIVVSDLWLNGPGSSTFAGNNDCGINAFGASASSYITDITVENCEISNFQGYGIIAQWLDKFSFINNRIHDVAYAGVGILSCLKGKVSANDIRDVNLTASSANAYGIFVSRNTGTTVTYPLSKYISVNNNIVTNVTGWEGLDTHAGQNISFIGNLVTNCPRGIVAGPDSSTNAPNHIVISNNVIDSTVTNGSSVYGIVMAGNSNPTYAEGCIVQGNSIIRCGDTTSATGGALYVYATKGLVVKGNSFIESSPIDMYFQTPANIGLVVEGNSSIDVWSSSVARATAIQFSGDGHSGIVKGNIFTTQSKSATYVLTEGVRFDASMVSIAMLLSENLITNSGTPVVNEPAALRPFAQQTAWTNVPGASGVFGNLLTLALTPGPWYLDAAIEQFSNSGTGITSNQMAISTSSGSTTTDHVAGTNVISFGRPDSSSGQVGAHLGGVRLNITAPTTVYLKLTTTYASGNPQFKASFSARRA